LFLNVIPKFEKGRVLKKEMLENLRDYPRNFFDIYYKDYSDGIISGTDVYICEKTAIIKKGIVKHKGRIYMLEDEFEIPYYHTNKETLIKIKFDDEKDDLDYCRFDSRIIIDDDTKVKENEMELGRFKLREGAVLRSEYADFYDFSTEFNTINIINVEYAGRKKSTISPVVMNYFANIVFKNNSENMLDVFFAMQCVNNNTVERDIIQYYISNRLGIDYKDYSNLQIYRYLALIVKEIESGIKRKADITPDRPSRIIVD
jgi:hypothetical protein